MPNAFSVAEEVEPTRMGMSGGKASAFVKLLMLMISVFARQGRNMSHTARASCRYMASASRDYAHLRLLSETCV